MNHHVISITPRVLGYLGLLPFVVPAAFLIYDHNHFAMWQHFLLSYGAIILTFVGALHWSFAMTIKELPASKQRSLFLWSITPSLAAWISLSIPKLYGFMLLIIFFALAFWRDEMLVRKVTLAAWYLPMRRNLTLVAIACLLLGAFLTKNHLVLYRI